MMHVDVDKYSKESCENLLGCGKKGFRKGNIFVHIYMHHFERLQYLKVEAHVNQCYKHFYFFVTEYSLVEAKELEPLREMSQKICW